MDGVRRLYQCMYSWEEVIALLRERANHTSWEGQDEFIQAVVKANPQWPLGMQYRSRLFRAYLKDVNDAHEEVHEDLLSHYLLIASAAASKTVADISQLEGEQQREELYRIFELADGTRVPVKQRVEFNEVAETIWPAGLFMAEWLMQHADVVRGRRALELGCGVGITGLFVRKACAPQRLVLSDYSEAGLDFTRENLAINGLVADGLTLDVRKLDWTQFDAAAAAELGPIDVLYMADCWYDIDVSDACVACIKMLCTRNPGCYLLNATAIRNPKTYEAYRAKFVSAGFTVDGPYNIDRDRCVFPSSVDRYAIVLEKFSLPPTAAPTASVTAAARREIRLLSVAMRPQSDSARAGRGILLALQRVIARHQLGDRVHCTFVLVNDLQQTNYAALVEGADVLLVGTSVTQNGPSSASRIFWERLGEYELGGVHASSWVTSGGVHTGGDLAFLSNLSSLRAMGACVFSLYQRACIFTMDERDAAIPVGDFTLLDVWFMEQFAKVSILVALASSDRVQYAELQQRLGIRPRYWMEFPRHDLRPEFGDIQSQINARGDTSAKQ